VSRIEIGLPRLSSRLRPVTGESPRESDTVVGKGSHILLRIFLSCIFLITGRKIIGRKDARLVFRREIRDLIWVYFFLSLGGLLLHLRIHPPGDNMFNWVPAIFGAVNAFVLPFLFNSPGTVTWACLFTWATVLTGTVTMAYFSIITWAMPVTVKNVIMFSTLADILILLAKLPLAHKILRVHRPQGVTAERRGCAE